MTVALDAAARTDRVDLMLQLVAREYGVTVEQLRGPSRARWISAPRQVAMYLASTTLGLTLREAAAVAGRTDHTTAIYARRVIAACLAGELEPAGAERIREIAPRIERILLAGGETGQDH